MSLQLATRIFHVKDGNSYDTIDILRGAKGESPDIDDALSDVSENPVQNKVIKGALDDKVDVVSGKGLSTNDFTTTLKDKLTKTNVTYCTCATSGSTATKVVSIASGANTNFNFYVGAIVAVKFTYSNTAQNPKLNVNNTGAMPVRANGSQITTTYLSYAGYANRTILYMYNGVEWTFLGWDTDSSSTYSDATQSVHGLMSTSDKIKLDGIDTGANKTVVDNALDGESTNPVQNAVVTEALDGKADIGDLAPAYSTSGTYAVGDYVTYGGDVYRCTTAITTAEAWTAAHWTQVTIGYELSSTKADLSQLEIITPEQFGAVGDGATDDSQAVQDAVDAGYNIYFGSNKTYYLASTVTIDHDCHLFGGENTVIRTETQNGTLNNVFVVSGTLKKTTTLTTDYTSAGTSANSGNQFTLADMVGIEIGDILVITAEDQYYSYARQYYYLGATLLIGDMYNGHLYTTNSMPWDVALTSDVSVKIYDAPNVIIENLNFMADQDSVGHYKYMITLNECKNSIIRNCNLSEMDGGISLYNCVNTLIEGVSLAKSKSDNSIVGDGYGIVINSCSETIAQRIEAICAQSCFCLSGTIPNINTYLKNCNLASECRNNAVGLHENSYNLIVEDCTLTCLNLAGTVTVNRCRFIQNNRIASTNAMNIVGSHNPVWAEYKVNNCIFDGMKDIYITASSGQSQIQSFDNIVGLLEIKNCTGGLLIFDGSEQSYILSNAIKELKLINWDNCYEFYRTSALDTIEKMTVIDCTFGKYQWLNDHNASHGFLLTNIYEFDYRSTFPMQHKLSVDKYTYGGNYTLPQNVAINLSSNNSSAKYVVCGNNVRSDNPEDYAFGSVSGSDGGTLSRSISVGASVPTLTKDSDGNFVVTQQNNANKYDIFPVCMFYIKENASIEMSAVLKNTGVTSGATFRPYIAIIDCTTGKLLSRYSGTAIQATAQGETIAYNHTAMANCIAMCYFYCNSPVASAQTTFEDYKIRIFNVFAPSAEESIQPYEAKRITGDGTILSLEGVNNIMSSEMNFHVSFGADYVANPIGILPTGEGVSF